MTAASSIHDISVPPNNLLALFKSVGRTMCAISTMESDTLFVIFYSPNSFSTFDAITISIQNSYPVSFSETVKFISPSYLSTVSFIFTNHKNHTSNYKCFLAILICRILVVLWINQNKLGHKCFDINIFF